MLNEQSKTQKGTYTVLTFVQSRDANANVYACLHNVHKLTWRITQNRMQAVICGDEGDKVELKLFQMYLVM